jgi:hypothetical protein
MDSATSIEVWFNKFLRVWVVKPIDNCGNQVGGASHHAWKSHAILDAKRLELPLKIGTRKSG